MNDPLHPTFEEWRDWWGKEKLREHIKTHQHYGRSKWKDVDSFGQFPAWELVMGTYWVEPIDEWHERWQRCGGKLFDGRMIACKRDPIWEKLSTTFADGLGKPYPPFAKSSCANWMEINHDECDFLGVEINSETVAAYEQSGEAKEIEHAFDDLSPAEKVARLSDLKAAKAELQMQIYASFSVVKIACPSCGQHIEMPGEMLHHAVTCPSCNCCFPGMRAEIISPHRIK